MAKQFQYNFLSGPFSYWKVADAWAKGYNHAKGLKWNSDNAASYKCTTDMHDGYMKDFPYNRDGFFVVMKVELTQKQRKEIDEKDRQKNIATAEKEIEIAMKRISKLQKA